MKKMMILVTIMMLGLTGCGNKTAETNVTETNELVEETTETVETEEIIPEKVIYSEEYVEAMKYDTIVMMEEDWEEEGIPSEECKDEIIELIKSIEYDPNFEYGYDLESLQIDYVNILVKYDVLPEECYGKGFDDAYTTYEDIVY